MERSMANAAFTSGESELTVLKSPTRNVARRVDKVKHALVDVCLSGFEKQMARKE